MVTNRKRSPSVATEIMLRRAAESRVETLQAQLDAALDALSSLVAHVQQVGGYLAPEDQMTLLRARTVLVECGRKVER